MSNLKVRVAIILGLVALSVFAIWPRDVTVRTRTATGIFHDTTVRRVPIKFGLDLSGGMHVALEVDESRGVVADKPEAIDRALTVVRNRIDQFGVGEQVIQKVGEDRIIVELPGVDNPAQVQRLVSDQAFLEFQIVDETGALERVLPRLDQIVRERGLAAAPQQTAQAQPGQPASPISKLFTPGDTAARDTAAADTGATAAGDTNPLLPGARGGAFSGLLQAGGMPGEYVVANENIPALQRYLALPEVQAAIPVGKELLFGVPEAQPGQPLPAYTPLYVVDRKPIITGEYLTDARPATDPIEGNIVTFELNNVGGRRFYNETSRHVGDYMAIVLDERVMGRPPVIQSPIRTRGQITLRGRSVQEANDLALVLRAGALPVPLQVVEIQSIGPSLGQDAIDGGIRAGILGVLFVILFLLVYYRKSGALAVAALATYGIYTLGILAGFDATLTLPGIAGFVLSIGMAVDANVLIFERIREELGKGRTVRAAVDDGFRHALSAIVDSNVTTALTAVILYQVGTQAVRGFAVTLLAGLAASMISAIFVTRTLFLLWMQRNRAAQTLSI